VSEIRHGTQSIERAVRLLAEVTARSRFGWRPADLAARCGLDRGTTHRILACLVRERLVHRRSSDGHYLPGPLLFELALALPAYEALRKACEPVLARIARRTHGYALLCVRSLDDALCIASAGRPAYLGTAFDVGTRRPLVANAAGVAMLLPLPRRQAQEIVDRQTAGTADAPRLARMWRRSLALGFAANIGYTARGVNAVAVAVSDPDGSPFGSVAIAASAAELPMSHLADTAAALGDDARRIERLARQLLPGGAYNAQARPGTAAGLV
jgi:DNA-binding IclR family transcriptional regulator